MKAVVCYGNGNVKYEDISEPITGKDEVKIQIKACGICRSDIPRAISNKAHHYPLTLGHEFSGIVAEIGENVSDFSIGDKVTVAPLLPCFECEECQKGNYSLCPNYSFIGSRQQGAMAEYITVPSKNVVKLSDDITFEQGALFEPATVALHAFYQANYKPCENVAIIGGGTIGLFALQWAKILGCKRVVVFGRDKTHLEIAKQAGADYVISTLDKDFTEQVLKITEQKGFDYVFETAGSTTTIKLSFNLVRKKGDVCLVGTPTSEMTFTVREWEQLNRKEFHLTGSWMSYSSPFPGKEWEMTKRHFADGSLKIKDNFFYKKFQMQDADKAFELFKNVNEKVKGRVLLFI